MNKETEDMLRAEIQTLEDELFVAKIVGGVVGFIVFALLEWLVF